MSHPQHSQPEAGNGPLRRPGRWRAAWAALLGAPVVPEQIRAEWAAWQLELEAICDKIGAAANRLQTRHKRDLDKALAELDEYKAREANPLSDLNAPAGAYSPVKRALNRRILAARGVNIPNGGTPHVDGAESE